MYYGTPPIVTSGLVLNLDAANSLSYTSGSTTWRDLSGNGNSGTLVSGSGYSSQNGGSIVFDGTNDYVSIGSNTNLTNPLTVCAFINTAFVTGSNQVIYGPSANGNDNWLSISNNRIQLVATEASDVNTFSIGGNTFIEANKWYYVTGIVNNNVTSIHLNGVLEAISTPQAFTIGGWNSTTRIGQRASGQFPFGGQISLVQAYNRVLSQQEILQNYNALKSRFGLQ